MNEIANLKDFMTHKVRGEDRYLVPLFVERVNGKYILQHIKVVLANMTY